MNKCRFSVEVKVIFVESKRLTKKGKPEMMRIELRKMFLIDPNPLLLDSGDYRIFKKGDVFTISVIEQTVESCWTNPTGKVETWYKKKPDWLEVDQDGVVHTCRPFKRTPDKAMDEAGLLVWLTHRMGQQGARVALETLLTQEPENQRLAA